MRYRQRHQQLPAVGVRIHSHATVAGRRKFRELVAKLAAFVEQFMWPIALHPVFKLLDVFGILEVSDRHLMRTPSPFHRLSLPALWPRPAFWRAGHDHGPTR